MMPRASTLNAYATHLVLLSQSAAQSARVKLGSSFLSTKASLFFQTPRMFRVTTAVPAAQVSSPWIESDAASSSSSSSPGAAALSSSLSRYSSSSRCSSSPGAAAVLSAVAVSIAAVASLSLVAAVAVASTGAHVRGHVPQVALQWSRILAPCVGWSQACSAASTAQEIGPPNAFGPSALSICVALALSTHAAVGVACMHTHAPPASVVGQETDHTITNITTPSC